MLIAVVDDDFIVRKREKKNEREKFACKEAGTVSY